MMSTNRNFDESKVKRVKGRFAPTTGGTAKTTPKKPRTAPALPPSAGKTAPARTAPTNTLGAADRTLTTKSTSARRDTILRKKKAMQRLYTEISALVYADPAHPETIAQRQKWDNALKKAGFPHGIDWNTRSV
jgi:hypothetical protein